MANSVNILIKADDQASREIDRVNEKAGGLGKTLGDVGKVAAGFFAANVIGEGVSKLSGFISGSVSAASDLGESLNAVNVVFKDSAHQVLDWGKNNATQFGLSQRAFNQLATPLGAMLKNTGMSMDQVADTTINLTERAADMASVFNTDVGDALGAIQAALRGETDPIEKYGVSLSAANVEARALADTGKKSAKALTDQEKAAARLALLFEQTNAVAGDFRNTSDGLANSQRINAARTEELQAKIGEKLIPVMLKVNEVKLALVQTIADKLLPAFDKLANFAGPILSVAFEALSKIVAGGLAVAFEAIAGIGGSVLKFFGDFIGDVKWVIENGTGFSEKLVPGLGFLSEAFGHVAEAAGEVQHFFSLGFNGGQVGGELSGIAQASFATGQRFGEMGRVIKDDVIPNVKDAQHFFALGFNGGQVGGELGTIQMAAFNVGKTFREDVIPATQEMAAFVAEKIAALIAHLDEHFQRFPAYFNEEVRPALQNIIDMVTTVVEFFRAHWPEIEAIVKPVLEELKNQIETGVTIITRTLDIVIKLLQGDWAGAWNSAKELFRAVWESMQETASNVGELIAAIFGGMADAAVDKMRGMKNDLLNAAADIKYGLIEAFQQTKDWLGRVWDGIVDVIKWPINEAIGLINRLISAWNGLSFGVGGGSFMGVSIPRLDISTPDVGYIPYLAKGGIVNRPTLAMIGEGGHPEAVVPLSGPNARGLGSVINIYVQQPLGTPQQIAAALQPVLTYLERRGGLTAGTTRAVTV